MSAQTTVTSPSTGLHLGLLGAAIIAVAGLIVALALAVALLQAAFAPAAAPAFDAPGFRAEERALQVLPAFDAPAFRTEERGFSVPPAFDAPAFRAEERDLTIPEPEVQAGAPAERGPDPRSGSGPFHAAC